MVNHNHLIRQGLESARRNGKKLGRPYGTVIPTAEFLEKHTDIVRRLKCGDSIRTTAAVTKRSKGLVEKVRRVLKGESPPLLPPPPPPPRGDAG